MEEETNNPFSLETKMIGKKGNIAVPVLKKEFQFLVRECCNISANLKQRFTKANNGTLSFLLVDPIEPETKDPRKIFKAFEFKPLKTENIPTDLKEMVGTRLTIKRGCQFIEGCFLLTSDTVQINPPPRNHSKLIMKPNSKKVKQSLDTNRSSVAEDFSNNSLRASSSSQGQIKFDIGNGIKLTEEEIDREIEALFNKDLEELEKELEL